ncbi:MAG: hypothetical protein ABSG91_19645 [Syntrophobacteraceae bacterium]
MVDHRRFQSKGGLARAVPGYRVEPATWRAAALPVAAVHRVEPEARRAAALPAAVAFPIAAALVAALLVAAAALPMAGAFLIAVALAAAFTVVVAASVAAFTAAAAGAGKHHLAERGM